MKNADIAIVITCYNKQDYIADAINSATVNNCEVFVVDDCSTDNSWQIICNIKGINKIQLEQNSGVSAATIAGLSAAKSQNFKYVILLDGDDVLAPNAASHYQTVFNETASNAIYSSAIRYSEKDARKDVKEIQNYEVKISDDPLSGYFSNFFATTCLCSEIDVILEDLDPLPRIQDHQIGLLIHRNSKRVAYSSGQTHFCSQAINGENLALDNPTKSISAVTEYSIHWHKISKHPLAHKYQRRAFSYLIKMRHYKILNHYFNLFFWILAPFKKWMPSYIKHKFLMYFAKRINV